MDLDFAFLCDAADSGGKLHALGIGIDTVYVREVPALHPGFTAVMRLRFASTEEGSKKLTVRVMDPDGDDVVPRFEGDLQVQMPHQEARQHATQLISKFQPIHIRKHGPHSVVWLIQGQEVTRVQFAVVPPPDTT